LKSTRSFSWIKVVALVFLASCAGASLANAQEFRGQFSLPFEARWGAAVLPAGEYTFTLDEHASQRLVIVRGEAQQAMVLPQNVEFRAIPHQSALIAVRSGGEYRIRGLYIDALGMFLDYGLTAGGQKHSKIAQAPVLIRRLPVAVAGK
jgi:hypothetical protein